MAGLQEYVIIIGVIAVGFLVLPILLDDNGFSSITNGICTIITGSTNVTCNQPQGNVTFVGLGGINIFSDFLTNTVYWNFTTPITIANNLTLVEGDQIDITLVNMTTATVSLEPCGDQEFIMYDFFAGEWICVPVSSVNGTKIHTSLGGDADVFKFENTTHVALRGISEGIGVNVTERTDDILIALKQCTNNQVLVYNDTTDIYDCKAKDKTHISLGGTADVFKFENTTHVAFRGITNGTGIALTEQVNDILVALKSCLNNQFLVYNTTTSKYECTTLIELTSTTGVDVDEIFTPRQASTRSSATAVSLSLTNYDVVAIKELGVGVSKSFTSWVYPVPLNFPAGGSSIDFYLFWITTSGSAGTVCHTFEAQSHPAGASVDGAFGTSQQICTANAGTDVLVISKFTLTSANNNFDANELGAIQVTRDPAHASDTYTSDAYILGGRLVWIP